MYDEPTCKDCESVIIMSDFICEDCLMAYVAGYSGKELGYKVAPLMPEVEYVDANSGCEGGFRWEERCAACGNVEGGTYYHGTVTYAK